MKSEAVPGRVISASCFRVVALQSETQNEAEVLKPILEELEVLRLSCVLGALPNVNPKDFDFQMLEAKEFDEDLSRFLRSNVFGEGAQDGPQVRVVGVFGKQAQVKAHLRTLGAWGQRMEETLRLSDMGMYAVLLRNDKIEDDVKTVVFFTWLLDDFFHPDRLRQTPTYMLRLLTCVTSNVTCCLANSDKAILESLSQVDDGNHKGEDDEWGTYSVAFRVEQQQDMQDSVRTTILSSDHLAWNLEGARIVEVIKGTFPGLISIGDAPPSKNMKRYHKSFDGYTGFIDWLFECRDRFDIEISQSKVKRPFEEAFLRRCGAWPSVELEDSASQLVSNMHQTRTVFEKEHKQEMDEVKAQLSAVEEMTFTVDAIKDDQCFAGQIEYLKTVMNKLTAQKTFALKDEIAVILRLPIRLPRLLHLLLHLFESGDEEQFNDILSKAHIMTVRAMHEVEPRKGFVGTVRVFWNRLFQTEPSTVPDAFRERMRVPLETLRYVWWSEVSTVLANYHQHIVHSQAQQELTRLRECTASREDSIVNKAYSAQIARWANSTLRGLKLTVRIDNSWEERIQSNVTEEYLEQNGDELRAWSFKNDMIGTIGSSPRFLGAVRLSTEEQVVKVFAIQTRSLLVVTTKGVKRIEFADTSWMQRDPFTQNIHRLGKSVTLSDFYSKERQLVLCDNGGQLCIYRLNEKFTSMEAMRSLNISVTTSLNLPLADILLSDGTLHLVDRFGSHQSLNTRNQQTSRKYSMLSGETNEQVQVSLCRLLDGAVLACVIHSASTGTSSLQFYASEDMRRLPHTHDGAPMAANGYSCCIAFDNMLFMLSPSQQVVTVKIEAMLKSESYRIRTIGTGTDPSLSSGPNNSLRSHMAITQHWLWSIYHVYEKFPVLGELERDRPQALLALSFSCEDACSSEHDILVRGCKSLLLVVMEKLYLLNKPLLGMDLAKGYVEFVCGHDGDAMLQLCRRGTCVRTSELLEELITFIPVQICRAEFNTLTLMIDGQRKSDESDKDRTLHSADIARELRFGLLSPLLQSWRRQCVVITSMGKQSTGKSYFLNHLTGSSFAIAGARCTDGAWMSVRTLPCGVLLVVIDFEGLGSFERTEQEDVFLSVLNASVSMLTIFRMEMRLDKEIDELFSKFQKGSQLIKSDPQLFRGKLYMSVKDVNPNDQRGVVDEFVSKFQRLLDTNKENNFLMDMYAGQLDINCSPPLGTCGYYRSLSLPQRYLETSLCGNPETGFTSGKAFLDCIRLLLAKISILDWTSLDESATKFKIAEVVAGTPSMLRFGCAAREEQGEPTVSFRGVNREPIVSAVTRETIRVSPSEVCAMYPSLATKWSRLSTIVALDEVDDEIFDLGRCTVPSEMEKVQAATETIRVLFQKYLGLTTSVSVVKKRQQSEFDSFLSFVVRRRCIRVQKWASSLFQGRVPDEWKALEQQTFTAVQTLLVRCLDTCAQCKLGCMKASSHSSSGDSYHDCGGDHFCSDLCSYCSDSGGVGKTPRCDKVAGHDGKCECAGGDHTCRHVCHLSRASNCGGFCSRKAGHDSDGHRCSVGMHRCGQRCVAKECRRQCVLDFESPHTAHKCEVDRCMSVCVMDGCNHTCSSSDHFHGQMEAKISFEVENPSIVTKSDGTFDDSSEKPVIHMCDEKHACQEMCTEGGICHIDVFLKQSAKTFVGERGSFQYTYQEMNGSRKKCGFVLPPGQMTHPGIHSCCPDLEDNDVSDGDAVQSGTQVRHYCDVRCPCCSYYCQKEHGHSGLHKTTHGNMRNTIFQSDEHNIDFIDRKYAAGERGTAEMCNLFCSKMGRGHVHYLDCDKPDSGSRCVYTGSSEDMRRHCTRHLEPKPDKEQDELLHERFWDTLGWEDPCTSAQERYEFGKCAYQCDAPDHDDKPTSYCVLPAWHAPVTKRSNESDGFSYVGGHKFECSHVSVSNKMHHVFVLDASGSMQGWPWQKLHAAFHEYVQNRVSIGATEDIVSVVTFDSNAQLVWEGIEIGRFVNASIPYKGGGTSFGEGLRCANEVLSRSDFNAFKPVVIFFSDGHPTDGYIGEQLAAHIESSYAKYGLSAFAVGFGNVNLSVLERIAMKLGGSYVQVLTGDELKTTFHTISASLGTRAGLALTKPLHEMICVICQKELSSEATSVLAACRHELHLRCLHQLMESGGAEAKQCPTCRQAITTADGG